jgi:hypothetical protein
MTWTSPPSTASEALVEDLLNQCANIRAVLLALKREIPLVFPDVLSRRLAPYGGISKAVRFVGQPSIRAALWTPQ